MVSVLVYERDKASGGFQRIGTFEPPEKAPLASPLASRRREVRIIYQGGVHYDALEPQELGAASRSEYGPVGSPVVGPGMPVRSHSHMGLTVI